MADTNEFKRILLSVDAYVAREKYAYIVPECMLVALMDDAKVRRLVSELTSDERRDEAAEAIKAETETYIRENVSKVERRHDISMTPAYGKLLQAALAHAVMRGETPSSLDLFAALFNDKEQASAYFLAQHGITARNVADYLAEGRGSSDSSGKSMLDQFSVDLCEMAEQGRIDPLIGRDREVERIIQVLSKKKNANPVLVGREGTGKSAVVEGLALRIVHGEVPDSMKGRRLVALDLAGMVSGTKFRGEFEKRLHAVIREAISHPEVILFLDEIHTICGAGEVQGSMDASNILKPYLSRGEIHVIGATTYDDYKSSIEKDRAFARRFKKIDVCEPTREETVQIMKGLRKRYEDFHGIAYCDDVLECIVDLSGRFLFDKCFPDKAIDVMDEIGAAYRSGLRHGDRVTMKDVESVVCSMAHIPELTVERSEKDRLRNLGDMIKKNLFGNDEIVDAVVRKIRMAKAGIANRGKPVFTGLLCGPTGCGKTEFAKQLASNLDVTLVRLNMSEYSEEYSTSKLIGAAAGYVGFEQSGALTEPLIQHPHAVVLLDEIEKAHPNVYNLLLQVLDEGQLTDNHGREASFRNAIILMTSNVGVADSERVTSPLGFVELEGNTRDDRRMEVLAKGLRDTFSPEFRNRLTNIFYFNPIARQTLLQIVDKQVRLLNESLADKHVTVRLTAKAREHFADAALRENSGGRPVERLMQEEVSEKIADEILFGQLERGGTVKVECRRHVIQLHVSGRS